MDQPLLNHLLHLAASTGDRLIVVDPDSRQPFVLMGISQYEALLAHEGSRADFRRGFERESPVVEPTMVAVAPGLDAVAQRANAELAAWRASQQATAPAQAVSVGGFVPEPLQSAATDDDRFYVEPLE